LNLLPLCVWLGEIISASAVGKIMVMCDRFWSLIVVTIQPRVACTARLRVSPKAKIQHSHAAVSPAACKSLAMKGASKTEKSSIATLLSHLPRAHFLQWKVS